MFFFLFIIRRVHKTYFVTDTTNHSQTSSSSSCFFFFLGDWDWLCDCDCEPLEEVFFSFFTSGFFVFSLSFFCFFFWKFDYHCCQFTFIILLICFSSGLRNYHFCMRRLKPQTCNSESQTWYFQKKNYYLRIDELLRKWNLFRMNSFQILQIQKHSQRVCSRPPNSRCRTPPCVSASPSSESFNHQSLRSNQFPLP